MLSSIEKVWDKPVDIHLGNHPWNNSTIEKRKKQLEEGGNPFISPGDWKSFLSNLKICIEKVIKDNEELNEKIGDID